MNIRRISGFAQPSKIRQLNKCSEFKFNPKQQEIFNNTYNKYNFKKAKPVSYAIKRGFDLVCGVSGLVLTSPLILISGIALKLETKGPIIFKQQRIGQDGKIFTMYKLRTMYNDAYKYKAVETKDDKRITKIGKILRKYSIDEFPQFLNIIKGDMSLIGPRPLPLYEQEAAKNLPEFVERYVVKPGAKLNYKNIDLSNPQQRLDIEKNYIENWNIKSDIENIMTVIKSIILGKNF